MGPSCARRKGKSSESKNDMEYSSEIRSFDAKRRWTIAAVRRRLFAVDDAVLHDEGYFLQGGDVVEGIAGDGDDVGEVAGLERADLIFPLQQFCAVDGAGLNGSQRSHAEFHHQDEFACLSAVGEWADVGAHGDGDSGGELLFKFL